MAVKVVDASAIAALLFGEQDGESVARMLGDATLVAPSLMEFELANVCIIKSRRHPEQRAALQEAFRLRDQLAVQQSPINQDEAVELAAATGLTAYDASYLWLAQHLGAELITLDRQLANAALSSSR